MKRNRHFRTTFYHRLNLQHNKDSRSKTEWQDSLSQKSMIAPVKKINQKFVAELTFRTFDWLLAEKLASQEFTAGHLDETNRSLLLLNIYPNQSTALHLIASETREATEPKAVELLKSLLEPYQEPSDSEVAEIEGDELFKVPIIHDANGMTPFRQMNKKKLKSLSDVMMFYMKFQSIVNDQQDVQLMLEQNASNMIKCIDTSLRETPATRPIDSI